MNTVSAPTLHVPVAHDLLHATIVRVSVRDLRLHAYPKRHGEVVLYHVAPRNLRRSSPVKPHQILFVVDGIPPHHKLTIRPSAHNGVTLSHLTRPKDFTGPTATMFESGVPDKGPVGHLELIWEYDILLIDTVSRKTIDLIDPPVIIKEDP